MVFNVFSVDWSCATRRESASALYCVVYLAYERLKIEILVTPLPRRAEAMPKVAIYVSRFKIQNVRQIH